MKPWPEDIQKKLDEASCKQLLVVRTDRHPADIRWYERHLGRFVERRSLCAKGAIGFGGVTRDKREGDGCTPDRKSVV